MLAATKGARQIEAKGSLRIDEQHRPAGQLNLSAAGLDGLLGNLTGGRLGGNLLGMLLGQGRTAPAQPNAKPQLASLPPLRLENGFLAMGPFVIPNVKLQPLY
jgi:predicted lipid-binding transport protein (Tim44 family)